MAGPWHTPEHPDERDNSVEEATREQADFEERVEAHLREQDDEDLPEENVTVSKHYIDRGAHRTFRYEARGDNGTTGYALKSYRTKEEALEAVLRDKETQELYKNVGPGSWDA